MVAAGSSEAKKRAYVIADNKLALNAGWDEDLLAAELTDLRELAFDMDLVGFEASELERLLGSAEAVDREDEVPEAPETPVSRAGDLWLLGRNRLTCGDATSQSDVARLLGDVRPHLMVTDPPYGVDYVPGWRNDTGASQTRRTGKVMNDDRADWREAWALFPGEVSYVWHGAPCRNRGREPRRLRVRDQEPDRLDQGAAGAEPRALSLAARAMLVCGEEGRLRGMGRRPQADHRVADRQQGPGCRDGARHA